MIETICKKWTSGGFMSGHECFASIKSQFHKASVDISSLIGTVYSHDLTIFHTYSSIGKPSAY